MKLRVLLLVFLITLLSFQTVSANSGADDSVVTLTAAGIDGANDIEFAIELATADGTRPGTVILDGQEGPFVFNDMDRSLNIYVPNLTIRGVNQAAIENCDDGLFFDDLAYQGISVQNILVEDITFSCTGDGVEAPGAFTDVTLRGNTFQVGLNGMSVSGSSSNWQMDRNLIYAGGDGLELRGARDFTIAKNYITGSIGVEMMACSEIALRTNFIEAAYRGVVLEQESWKNIVQSNIILNVSQAGIGLGEDVAGNMIHANRVACAPETQCLTIDASPDVLERNRVAGNKP